MEDCPKKGAFELGFDGRIGTCLGESAEYSLQTRSMCKTLRHEIHDAFIEQ